MALAKQSKPPRIRLKLDSGATLSDDLAFFGQYVGPRGRMEGTEPRNQAQKEDFCLRRLLLALSQVRKLPLPLTLEAPASELGLPDFVLYPDALHEPLGIEITEAGHATWQRWLTHRGGGVKLHPGDGYAGDAPERIVVEDIRRAIAKKLQKLRMGNYSRVEQCDLLIYVNSEGGNMADEDQVAATLRQTGWSAFNGGTTFARLHVILGDTMRVDLFGEDRRVSLSELLRHERNDGVETGSWFGDKR